MIRPFGVSKRASFADSYLERGDLVREHPLEEVLRIGTGHLDIAAVDPKRLAVGRSRAHALSVRTASQFLNRLPRKCGGEAYSRPRFNSRTWGEK